MAVDDDRRRTASARRGRLIESLTRALDPLIPTSSAARLRTLIDGPSRSLIVSGDIDGLVSAAMLARVAPRWRAVALIVKSDSVLVHPRVADDLDLSSCFGVDVFSSYIPNVSNHVALWGGKKPGNSASALAAAKAHDQVIRERASSTLLANASLWAEIEGSYGEAGARPFSAGYRYPLGTAQLLLALLEVIGKSPRMFDRDYLPWLVANCDGGLKTIRDYPHNVPMWWASLAAAVGPASLSEQLYQLASNQRPTEFTDVVNRLRAEGHEVEGAPARHLDDDWNLRTQGVADIAPVVRWITSISGWPDPFEDGAETLSTWVRKPLSARGYLATSGLPAGESIVAKENAFRAHLRDSLAAVHTNFAFFDQAQRLNWVAAWEGARLPELGPLPPPLEAVAESPGLYDQDLPSQI